MKLLSETRKIEFKGTHKAFNRKDNSKCGKLGQENTMFNGCVERWDIPEMGHPLAERQPNSFPSKNCSNFEGHFNMVKYEDGCSSDLNSDTQSLRSPSESSFGSRRKSKKVQGANRSEFDDDEKIAHIFTDVGNSKRKHTSEIPISRSLPSNDFEKSLGTFTSVENSGDKYEHIMKCISGLSNSVSTLATSIQPIVASWKKKGCSDSDEDEIKGSPNIDAPHHSEPVTTNARRISKIDSCTTIPAEHAEFQVADKVKILDPYDGAIAGTGQIQSLATIHGVPLSLEDANINVIDVTSNIPLAYEDPIDGCERLKETIKSFIRWPKKYLRKSSM